MTATIYPQAWLRLLTADLGDLFDPATDVRLMLAGPDYVRADSHAYAAAIGTAETYGGGYPAGGVALLGRTLTWDTVAQRAILGCSDVTWPAASWTAAYGIVYVNTGDPATSPLIACLDLGGTVTGDGTDYPMTWPDGLLRLGPPA